MVSFRNFVVSALALAAPIVAQSSPAEVAANLKTLTQKAQALQAPAKALMVTDGTLLLVGQGQFPKIISGYSDIVNVGSAYIQAYQPITPQPTAAEQTTISEAYSEFVRVNQETFNILIGKAGIFSTIPFVGQPVAAVLRAVQGIYDTLAFAIIDVSETKAADLMEQSRSLDSTLDTCINSYSGLQVKKRSLRFGTREVATEA